MSFPIYSEIMGVKLPSVVCLSCLLRLLCLSPISLDLSSLCLIFLVLAFQLICYDWFVFFNRPGFIQLLVDVIGFDNSFFLRWLICYEWSVFSQSVWLFQLNSLLLSLGLKIPFSCADSFVMSDLSFFNQSGISNDDWLSSFLHTGFFSFSWYCYDWFIFVSLAF